MLKKLPLACLFALGSFAAQSQIVFEETFEGTTGTALPTGWLQTTLATDGGWKSGTNTALSSSSFPFPAHGRFVGTNDDACNCNKSADFLTTPSIDLTNVVNPTLRFERFFVEGTYQGFTESMKVRISTNGGTTWTDLATASGQGGWVNEFISLANYANQTIKIGFLYNDGAGWTYGAGVDNVVVYTPLPADISVNNLIVPSYSGNNQPINLTGTLTNFGGSEVTSLTLNYSVDGGAPVSANLTGLSIAAVNGTYDYTHPTAYTPTTTGVHNLKIWANNINGIADLSNSNDTAFGSTNVAAQVVDRTTLFEEFTSSTCAPCASFNQTFDPLLETNNTNSSGSRVGAIKYQMNWPSPGTDPSYNPDGLTRRTYYGVSGIPSPWLDGKETNAAQADIDDALLAKSPASMSVTANIIGDSLKVTVNTTPYVNAATGMKLFVAVCERQYNYTGTTSQTQFHHAMRKMLPDGNGSAINAVSGTPINRNYARKFVTVAAGSTPAQNSYDLWVGMQNLEVVAFVQNTATKEIIQSAFAVPTGTSGIANQQAEVGVNIYPNPAANEVFVVLENKTNEGVTLDIINSLGETVYTSTEARTAGTRTVQINTSNLANGLYYARVASKGQNQVVKFNVMH